LVAALAFEAQHRVDHMFEHARARRCAVLGDMADEDRAAPVSLAKRISSPAEARTWLTVPGRALDQVGMHGLDGVDHDQRRWRPSPGRQDVPHRGCGGELHRGVAEAEAAGTETHLVRRLLAGNIGDREPARGNVGRRLKQKGRFADARIAADQSSRARDEAAAHGSVELGDAGAHPLRKRDLGVEPDQLDRAAAAAKIVPRREGRYDRARILDERVPFGAIAALALPAAADEPQAWQTYRLRGFATRQG
jgi:hypothetical protein